MDLSGPNALKFLAAKAPLLLKTTFLHSAWLSPTSSKWDLRTELVISVMRSMLLEGNESISKLQHMTTKDFPIKGNMWISKTTFPAAEEDDLRQALFRAIEELRDESHTDFSYTQPDMLPVEGEWTGSRTQATKDTPEPSISEEEKYSNLMKETTTDVTVLYFHGGAYYLCDPSTHRITTARLAKACGGRVFSTRYRLAPQHPFPAALVDALVAYLNLLYPAPGALHDPVPASNIVFAGDSAGGNLALVLMQTILQFHRTSTSPDGPHIKWRGQQVAIPLPAGAALNSPWCDITLSMPTQESNAKFDYLPPPSRSRPDRHSQCPLWPADPPRANLYCDGGALTHPLVSPLRARSWEGCPPIYFCVGEELLTDDGKVVAQRAASQGVRIVWDQFEAMPHCFAMILQSSNGARLCFEKWGEFCRRAVEAANNGDGEGVKTEGWFISAKTLGKQPVDVKQLTELSDEEVVKLSEAGKRKMIEKAEELVKPNARL
jgi:acetyl esterase/lipase